MPDVAGSTETTATGAPPVAAAPRAIVRGAGAVLLAVFLLSGASGLVYQVVWSRALTLVFGSTTQGVATVLAAFMGGLALGSFLASRRGDAAARPLRAYGLLEAGIATLSLLVLALLPVLDVAYRAIYPVAHLSLAGLTLVRFVLACLFLLPATTLMGATLPILSAYFERRGGVAGEGASVLYAVNTVGAVLGTAAAGFWLLPALGMTGATLLAAAGNLAAALGALRISRASEDAGREVAIPLARRRGPERVEALFETPSVPSPGARATVAAAIAVSGAGALVLEVVWTRTLSLVLGSSTQAFTVMLTTFLVGLALGSAAAARLLGRIRDPLRAFALAELGTGLTVYLGVFVFPELPYTFIELFRATRGSEALFHLGRFALAAAVMLAPTLLLGAVFPLAVRCWRLGASEAARPVGFLYAVNTLGAIAGSLAAGFLLVPVLGLRGSLLTGAAINLAVGGLLLAASPSWGRALRLGSAGAVLVVLPILPLGAPAWNPLIMTSGVFQYARHYLTQFESRAAFSRYHAEHRPLFYKDGPTTTVTVEKRPFRPDGKVWIVLTVNGKVDASSVADMDTQILLAQLPLLVAPDPRRVLVIGWGSGVTAGSVLANPDVAAVHAVEIEPAVIEASRYFRDVNRDPYDDPRLSIEINDARHALLVDASTYDVIISEPSNPWLSGPSRLFTREFFEIVRGRLAPGGILCQWVQLYGLDAETYTTLLRTMSEVFPEVVVSKGSTGDTLVMASDRPFRFDIATMERRMSAPAVAADLERVGVSDPAALLSRFRIGAATVRRMTGEAGPLNTDDNALVEFAAMRNLYRDTDIENEAMLAAAATSPLDQADLSGLPDERRAWLPVEIARALARTGQLERAARELDRIDAGSPPPPIAAAAAALRGDLHQRQGDAAGANAAWDEALRLDPTCLPAAERRADALLDGGGDAEAAVAIARRAVDAHPRDAGARILLGRALADAGKGRAAIAVFEAVEGSTSPSKADAAALRREWGRACFALGDQDCAVRELERYFHEPETGAKPAEASIAAALDLGRAHLALGRRDASLEPFRIAADLAASLAVRLREVADEKLRRSDLDGAEADLRRAVAWNATDAVAWRCLGGILMSRQRWADAERAWGQMRVRFPEDRTALDGLVEALIRQDRLGETAPLLRLLIDLEEDPGRIEFLRAELLRAEAAG